MEISGRYDWKGTFTEERDGITFDTKLLKAATDVGSLTNLKLLATARTDNLHIDTALVEFDKLVAVEVGDVALKHELVFRDDYNTGV